MTAPNMPAAAASRARAAVPARERSGACALGVIVPCHNEAEVIERKLRNLAWCQWPAPPADRPHVLLIVDDGSRDGTRARAEALLAALFPAGGPVSARVLTNVVLPGKCGAILTALGELERVTDLVVLTDADVILRPASLLALTAAFEARAGLGMACGAQEFVRDLHADGTCRGADGAVPVPESDVFDRFTARVRRIESRGGMLFSVHGQLLAWRTALGLQPTPGKAADDLDLMFQARACGVRIELLLDAAFLEVKSLSPDGKASQELRHARSYVQAMQGRACRPGAPLIERAQLLFYRHAPLAAPALVSIRVVPVITVLAALLLFAARRAESTAGLCIALAGLALLLALPVLALATRRGRHLVHLLKVIAMAKRLQRQFPLTDRWDMPRR